MTERANGKKHKITEKQKKGEKHDAGRDQIHRRRQVIYIAILAGTLLLHVLSWNSPRFCDWYRKHIFRIWVETYGRAMGLVPFSVGEILIAFGLLLTAALALAGLVRLAGRIPSAVQSRLAGQARSWAQNPLATLRLPGYDYNIVCNVMKTQNSLTTQKMLERQDETPGQAQRIPSAEQAHLWKQTESGTLAEPGAEAFRRRKKRNRLWTCACRVYAWLLLGAFAIMTLNCYILYHGSGFSGEYLAAEERDYTLEELAALRDFLAGQCNALCCRMPRKDDGSLSYEGDMLETAKEAMAHLGETYEGLSGFYPTPKPLRCSDFMSQQYIAGCYFALSMEANYNDVMYVMNLPSTLCHELGHLKGYILEDEANLIGYLACVRSEDIFFQYSGYLSVLYYVENDFRQALESSGSLCQASFLPQASILPQVHEDNIFLTTSQRARIEQEALLDTEAVDAISDSIADASLKLKGVEDGMISYSNVVGLLLRYYDIYGYP